MKNLTQLPQKGDSLRILMIGDVVGRAGRDVLTRRLPEIKRNALVDFVVVNAENATGGSGLSSDSYNGLRRAGVDCVTLGDHALRQKSIFSILNSADTRVIRPANLPPEAPGKGYVILETESTFERPAVKIAVISLLGRVFMTNQFADNPLIAADKIVERLHDVKIRILDFHAEATSETQIMGRYLDGRVSAVLGTHTHVQTADEKILPGGSAFLCDVGMTGSFDSIIGRKIDCVVDSFRTGCPKTFEVAEKNLGINGVFVDVDPATGKACAVSRLNFMEDEQ